MDMACEVHSVAHMIDKGGKGSKGKRKVLDITPVVLTEIRDGIRGLSAKMDGLEQRMDGLEQRMDRLEQRMDGLDREMVALRQDTHEEISKLRVHMERRFDLLERRVGALESAVFHRQ